MVTLSSYYNAWYKTGAAPSIATCVFELGAGFSTTADLPLPFGSETIIWWYRPHPTAATAWNDTLDPPRDVEWLEDKSVRFVAEHAPHSLILLCCPTILACMLRYSSPSLRPLLR